MKLVEDVINRDTVNSRTNLPSWKILNKHADAMEYNCTNRLDSCILSHGSLEIDYSRQRLNSETLNLLINLAHDCNLKDEIKSLIMGGIVNESQNLPALHTALRAENTKPLFVNNENIISDIQLVLQKMKDISEQIREGQWLGYSGKRITDVINIGMGGSDFGPRFYIAALAEYNVGGLGYYFISDADPNAFNRVTRHLNPETTLFIVSSKSFSTYETLHNAKKARAWIGDHQNKDRHFIAVTAQAGKAYDFGISTVLPIWDWIGGRYSLCSAINLIGCIAIGYDAFMELLAGARSMDKHFYESEFHKNMPIMLALLGIWNINFLHIPSLLMLVYAQQLELFIPYIQQLDMESNGKYIDKYGNFLNYTTGPIVWGGLGNQAQHSYYQLLTQSNHQIAADFISVKQFDGEVINLFCDAKMNILSNGTQLADNSNHYIKGGMPINHIKIESCTPFNLGALVALYEHKIFVQSVIWKINPFDQPGVENAKKFTTVYSEAFVY